MILRVGQKWALIRYFGLCFVPFGQTHLRHAISGSFFPVILKSLAVGWFRVDQVKLVILVSLGRSWPVCQTGVRSFEVLARPGNPRFSGIFKFYF